MTQQEYIKMKYHLYALKEVARQYDGRSIDNIIMQLESRINYYESKRQ